jgi:hypothetical protein
MPFGSFATAEYAKIAASSSLWKQVELFIHSRVAFCGSGSGTRCLDKKKPRLIDDAKHWRDRACEARAVAEGLIDPQSKRIMLDIAEGYERLALRAGERGKERAAGELAARSES